MADSLNALLLQQVQAAREAEQQRAVEEIIYLWCLHRLAEGNMAVTMSFADDNHSEQVRLMQQTCTITSHCLLQLCILACQIAFNVPVALCELATEHHCDMVCAVSLLEILCCQTHCPFTTPAWMRIYTVLLVSNLNTLPLAQLPCCDLKMHEQASLNLIEQELYKARPGLPLNNCNISTHCLSPAGRCSDTSHTHPRHVCSCGRCHGGPSWRYLWCR